MVRRAVVQDDGRAEHQSAGDEPGTHHPADVRRPEDHVPLLQVEAVREVLRGLERKPAVDMDCAFRRARRPRRVDHHERIFGGRVGEVRLGRMLELGPEHVAPTPWVVAPDAPHDDDRVDAGRRVRRRIGGLLHRHDLPAAVEAVGGDQHLRFRVAQAPRDRLGRVAREHRDEDRADRADREDGDRALDHQREEDGDAVALAHAERAESGADARDLRRQLAEGELPHRALLAFADDRDAGGVVAQRGRDVVHAAAAPPGGPWDPAPHVEHVLVRDAPDDAEIALGRAPEALEVFGRPALQRRVIAVAVPLGEAPQPASLEIRLARLPRRSHRCHVTTAHPCRSGRSRDRRPVRENGRRDGPPRQAASAAWRSGEAPARR